MIKNMCVSGRMNFKIGAVGRKVLTWGGWGNKMAELGNPWKSPKYMFKNFRVGGKKLGMVR